MAQGEQVSLEKLRQALHQPNNGIRKRALAIIFNEVRIEALDILEEYLGRETEPDLQSLALKVRRKLQEFQATSSQVPLDKLLALLHHSTTESRILALRGLVEHRSTRMAELVTQTCAQEEDREALGLIAKILKKNPSPANLPFLMRLVAHPAEEIRQDALEGILSVIFGCLYPLVLKALLDPAPQLKMRAYQLISNISRTNLLEALDFMFGSGDPAMSRLAGSLLPSFLGADLLPILERQFSHPDAETAALTKRAVLLMAQKGNWEAARLVEKFQAKGAAPASAASQPRQGGVFQTHLAAFPRFVTEPLQGGFPADDPMQNLSRLREVFHRFGDLLAYPFIKAYFAFAARNPFLDRTCFKVLQFGLAKANVVNLLRTVAPAFPPPAGQGDLFPLILADRIQNDFNDQLLEQMTSLQRVFHAMDEAPGELAALAAQATEGMGGLFTSLAPLVTNRLAVKYSDGEAVRVADFMPDIPAPIDQKLLQNFELRLNVPVLISQKSDRALSLFPFFVYDAARKALVRCDPGENDLWEFLKTHGILDSFFAYLKEKPGGN